MVGPTSVFTLLFSALFLYAQVNSGPTVIVAIGDSMTAGYGVDAESSYPAQLEKELNRSGKPYRVVNLGVTGSTTGQAMGRLSRAMAADPDMVIIQLGGNDAAQGISQAVTRDNIRRMIQRFKPGGARVFLAGGRFSYLDEVARAENIPVIPFLEGVAGNRELLLDDGAHPNAAGYAVVVKNILKALDPFIGERQPQRRANQTNKDETAIR